MSQEQYTTEKEERKKGKHLDAYERGQIEALKKLGKSNRAIRPGDWLQSDNDW